MKKRWMWRCGDGGGEWARSDGGRRDGWTFFDGFCECVRRRIRECAQGGTRRRGCVKEAMAWTSERKIRCSQHDRILNTLRLLQLMQQPTPSATGPAISGGGGPHACIFCISVATLSVSSGACSYASRICATSLCCSVYRVLSSLA